MTIYNADNVDARIKTLTKLIRAIEKRAPSYPEGGLRISHSHGKTQYYQTHPGSRGRDTYLTKNDMALVAKLAQKSYYHDVLKSAEQELRAWRMLIKLLPDKTYESVFGDLSEERQQLVKPVSPTDEEYRRQWESVPYEPGWFDPEKTYYMTERGEKVRSKSEQLIANLLYHLDIPYRYEYPITIYVDGEPRTWRPDFMILDIKHRKDFFLEHLGMMGNEDYLQRNLNKMKLYEENGLYEGHGMYYTFESDNVPIDLPFVKNKILRIIASPTGGIAA